MNIIKINSERQDNGLWGMPFAVKQIDNNGDGQVDEELVSAIIMKFSEYHPQSTFKVDIKKNKLLVTIYTNSKKKDFMLFYNDYKILDDKLYFLKTAEDKKLFNRKLKLKKLIDDLQKTKD